MHAYFNKSAVNHIVMSYIDDKEKIKFRVINKHYAHKLVPSSINKMKFDCPSDEENIENTVRLINMIQAVRELRLENVNGTSVCIAFLHKVADKLGPSCSDLHLVFEGDEGDKD